MTAGASGTSLTSRLSPRGRIYVERQTSGEASDLAPVASEAVFAAFEAGRAEGVLHLAAADFSTELPLSLEFWREVGRLFVGRVCTSLDPTDLTTFSPPAPDIAELAVLVESAPPMQGAEHLDLALLEALWVELGQVLKAKAANYEDGVRGYLAAQGSAWNVVGRVCLHLAENRNDPSYPFAFMATYIHKVSSAARPQYVPLGRALDEYVGARNRPKLVALLAPLSRAAGASDVIRELVESGDIYHPLAWPPDEAHRFLCHTAVYEEAGLIVRVPDWWHPRRRPRAKVTVSVGTTAPPTLGMGALLDFQVDLTLDGSTLGQEEVEALLAASHGLVLVKGKWVEVDHDKLKLALQQWQRVQAKSAASGVSFGDAMRMLAGVHQREAETGALDDRVAWSEVIAGDWLAARLEALRSPEAAPDGDTSANAGLKAELRPYQRRGVQWLETLRSLGLGGCLADDMGLGKTIQVIGVLNLARRRAEGGTDLLVVPASLIDNWRLEFERFAPDIRVLIVHPSRMTPVAMRGLTAEQIASHDAVISTYGTILRADVIKGFSWRHLVLDEAQAIKNPGAKQTAAVKALAARWRLAMTGTPVENSLGDLWSIFDFLNPGLLGSAAAFGRLSRIMAASPDGHAPLRRLIQPYVLRRLKTDRSVIGDLPDKTEITAHCSLTKGQVALYAQAVEELKAAIEERSGIARRALILAYLMRFKQICNHPSQWLGDNAYAPRDSGKFARLRELCEAIATRQEKALVFTQFREMVEPLNGFLAGVFGQKGLVLHGGTPVKARQALVARFQADERVPFMVLSIKAGGTGLNLTAASHVIHFDRWWNPAVENQATDRAFRIGQKKNVLVHKFVCQGTVEERIDALIAGKQRLSDEVLAGGAESSITEMSSEALIALVSLDLRSAMEA